jgi:hypothetical protein
MAGDGGGRRLNRVAEAKGDFSCPIKNRAAAGRVGGERRRRSKVTGKSITAARAGLGDFGESRPRRRPEDGRASVFILPRAFHDKSLKATVVPCRRAASLRVAQKKASRLAPHLRPSPPLSPARSARQPRRNYYFRANERPYSVSARSSQSSAFPSPARRPPPRLNGPLGEEVARSVGRLSPLCIRFRPADFSALTAGASTFIWPLLLPRAPSLSSRRRSSYPRGRGPSSLAPPGLSGERRDFAIAVELGGDFRLC